MNIGIVNVKGGAAKTTTAVHLAAVLQAKGKTALLDGDNSHNAEVWQARGPGFGFPVIDIRAAMKIAKDYEHFITDSGSDPTDDDLKYLAYNCDLLVVPTKPHPLETDGLKLTLQALKRLGVNHFKVLLTCCPPDTEPDTQELTDILIDLQVPKFKTNIPRLKAFMRAAGEGVIIKDVKDPRAERGWKAYQSVGRECLAYANVNANNDR